MIAPRDLPEPFYTWNHRWGAPGGRRLPVPARLRYNRWALKYRGPFALQSNSSTRAFEYPWVHNVVSAHGTNLDIVEIGGALSGMQCVFARDGHRVINVDPGAQSRDEWGFTPESHRYLCRLFDTRVTLIGTSLDKAGLPDASADVVLSVSVLEHLPPAELAATARHIGRILRPGGIAVFTIDLFVDLFPFTDAVHGRWGRNVDVRAFLDAAGLTLAAGAREELFGFPEFDVDRIKARRAGYLISDAGSTAQCLIARPRLGGER